MFINILNNYNPYLTSLVGVKPAYWFDCHGFVVNYGKLIILKHPPKSPYMDGTGHLLVITSELANYVG